MTGVNDHLYDFGSLIFARGRNDRVNVLVQYSMVASEWKKEVRGFNLTWGVLGERPTSHLRSTVSIALDRRSHVYGIHGHGDVLDEDLDLEIS